MSNKHKIKYFLKFGHKYLENRHVRIGCLMFELSKNSENCKIGIKFIQSIQYTLVE